MVSYYQDILLFSILQLQKQEVNVDQLQKMGWHNILIRSPLWFHLEGDALTTF